MTGDELSRVTVLTGNIGSGKSSAARILERMGATVISADAIAREVVLPGSDGLEAVVDRFGSEVLSAAGELDRRRLAEIVFSDPEALRDLEEITHPRIRTVATARLQEALSVASGPVIYDCPLYFEAGVDEAGFGPVLLIAAPDELCLARVMERDSLSREQAEARLREQLPMEEKRASAEIIVENSGSMQELESALKDLYPTLPRGRGV